MADTRIYTVGGTVQAGGGIYIPRTADKVLLNHCRAGAFVYILTPRQMGKSSLMVRTADQLAREGARSVIIDLTQIGTQVTADQWYLGLLTTIEDQLQLATDVFEWWVARSHLGFTQRLTDFFREVLLAEVAEPIVIFVDEIDTTLALDEFTDDFLITIRSLYNARSQVTDFRRLSFVLIGVATPSDLIRNLKITPLNLGKRIDLTDFTLEEALPLSAGFNLPSRKSQQVMVWVLSWTGGHPYLTQRLCRAVAALKRCEGTKEEVDWVVAKTFFGENSYEDNNLNFVRDMLTKRAPDRSRESALLMYRKIRNSRMVSDEEQHLVKNHLKLSGIVVPRQSVLRVRNEIYREVFNDTWIKEHLPVNWLKLIQRAIATAVGASAIALGFLLLSLYAIQQQGIAHVQASIAAMQRTEALRQARRASESARRARSEEGRALAARHSAEVQRARAERARLRALVAVKIARMERSRAEAQSQVADALRRRAEEQSKRIVPVQLAAQANILPQEQASLLPQSILLAVESLRRYPTQEAELILRHDLMLLPSRTAFARFADPIDELFFDSSANCRAARWVTDRDDRERLLGLDLRDVGGWRKRMQISFGVPVPARLRRISPDGRYILMAAEELPLYDPYGQLNRAWLERLAATPEAINSTIQMWDCRGMGGVHSLRTRGRVQDMALSADGASLATSSIQYKVRDLDASRHPSAADEKSASTEAGRLEEVGSVIQIWNLRAGKQTATFNLSRIASRVAWRADGKLVTVSRSPRSAGFSRTSWTIVRIGNYTIQTWNIDGIRAALPVASSLWPLNVSRSFVVEGTRTTAGSDPIRLSPDGRYLTAIDQAGAVTVWNTATGRSFSRIDPPDGASVLAFSPDGRYLATRTTGGDNDLNTIRVWQLHSSHARELMRVINPEDIRLAVFSPDSRYLATRIGDRKVALWTRSDALPADLSADDLIAKAGRCLVRNLTKAEWKRYIQPFAGAKEKPRKTFPHLPQTE